MSNIFHGSVSQLTNFMVLIQCGRQQDGKNYKIFCEKCLFTIKERNILRNKTKKVTVPCCYMKNLPFICKIVVGSFVKDVHI